MLFMVIHIFFYPFLMWELHSWAHSVKCWRSAGVYSHYSRNGNKLSEIYGLEINSAEVFAEVAGIYIPNRGCNFAIEINSAEVFAGWRGIYISKWGYAYCRNRNSPSPWNFDKLPKIKFFTYATALRITGRERLRKASPGDP